VNDANKCCALPAGEPVAENDVAALEREVKPVYFPLIFRAVGTP
jgi:hypothetical protein